MKREKIEIQSPSSTPVRRAVQSPILLRDVLETATQRLAAAGCDTPRLDAEVLLAHSLGHKERTWLYVHALDSLDAHQINEFEALLHRRERREPVAYIIRTKEFFGLEFEVNPHVLIPRPETELLVETALHLYHLESQIGNRKSYQGYASQFQSLKSNIVDVGTGSGCIAIALAKHLPDATIFAIDTSAEALQLAQRNAKRHNVADRITFFQGDLLQPLTSPVDLVVSNPPYVSLTELAAAMPEVSQHEPHLALDGGEDGLAVIQQLLDQARQKLKPGGSLLAEIGSSQGEGVARLAKTYFPQATVQVKKDLAGLDRLLVIEL